MDVDEFIRKKGLKYEDLTYLERQTYADMAALSQVKQLTVADIRKQIKLMRGAVERELIETDEFTYTFIFKRVNRKHILLKARLQNLLMLDSFIGEGDIQLNNAKAVSRASGTFG